MRYKAGNEALPEGDIMKNKNNNSVDRSNVVDLSTFRIKSGRFFPKREDITQWPKWKIKVALKLGYHPEIFNSRD